MQQEEGLAVPGRTCLRLVCVEDRTGHYVDCSDQSMMSRMQLRWQIVDLDRYEG